MIIGRNFAEKLYSESQKEKLYSTGNEELDELLERAFCEGYELGQRIFFDYSKYTPEEAEIVKADRVARAKYLLKERKNLNDALDKKLNIYKSNFTPMSSDSPEDAARMISRRTKLTKEAFNDRKERYNRLLDYSKEAQRNTDRKIDLIRNGKRSNITHNSQPDSKVNKFVKDNKVALGVAGGAALVGGGAYLIHRHNKKKKEAENKKNQDK